MQKIRGPKSGPLNRAAASSHQHRPEHGIAQHHPLTSTVRSTVSPAPSAPSAARYRAATSSHQHRHRAATSSHQHRPQHGIAQQHPHTNTVRTVRSTVSRSNILTPAPSAPSAARYRAAPSSHQHRPHRPQHGIVQQHPHTSTVRTVRSTVSRSNILTPAPSAPSAARYRAATSSHILTPTPSAARYRAATSSHQHRPHRPQHGIAQHHPHTSTVRTVRSTVSRSTILTPAPSAPSAARYRAATSSHQRIFAIK